MGSIRDSLKATKAKPRASVKFTLAGVEHEVEIVSPTFAVHGELVRRATPIHNGKPGEANIATLARETVIECAYLPGSNTRAFSPEDLPALIDEGDALSILERAALDALSAANKGSSPSGSSATQS
jgi:hypothetical protein